MNPWASVIQEASWALPFLLRPSEEAVALEEWQTWSDAIIFADHVRAHWTSWWAEALAVAYRPEGL